MKEVKKLKKQIKPKARVVFLLLSIFVILVSVSSVSATPLPTSSQVFVSTNGSDTNDGTAGAPYLTIQQGVDSVSENGTVTILNGVYKGTRNTNINISKNMKITGQSQEGTIIDGTGTNWIFNITSGINVTIQNLAIKNGYDPSIPGAINSSGICNIENCIFTNSSNAVENYGTMIVKDSTFTDNRAPGGQGGAIANVGSINVSGCVFLNNTGNQGGAIINVGSMNVSGCVFLNNTARDWGGAIVNLGAMNVSGCVFLNNTAGNWGGAIADVLGSDEVHFNTFIGNTAPRGAAIYNLFCLVNATDNWWGSNNPVWTNLLDYINPTTWLYMTINPTPTTINNTQNSLVTVSFNNIYNGTTVTSIDPANGHIPDGTLVTYSSTLGSFSPVTATTINGIANALFTANQAGTDNLNATTDNQTVSTLLTVNQGPTVTTVGGVNGYAGQNVTLTAYVDCYGNPVNEGTVTFTVGSTTLTPVTVTNGLATINWTIPTTWTVGNYTIVADYSGSSNYLASFNGTNLTVTPNPTTITVNPMSGYAGQNVTFTANLVDSNGNPVKDGQVTFKVNNTNIGMADVSNGTATITWTIPTTWTAGYYNVVAEYSGSNNYLTSTNNTLLTLKPSAYLYLNTTTSKANPTVGETFIVTYKLSNSGPNNATNVTVSFQIPTGLEFVNATVDNGTWTYNSTTRTITWNLTNVAVGDPYLYLTVKALGSGSYTIIPTITSETYNRNTNTLTPFTVNVQTPNNNNPTENNTGNNTTNTVNAATQTITMQNTGMPIAGLVLAILAIFGGMLPRRKQ